jgi:catechol 2,3-dioxygenase-like lactoylglutathione lyase family enzyme
MEGLSHIGLKSTDLGRTERFYVDVLGASVVNRREVPDRRIWLMLRGVRLEIAELPAWGPLDEAQRRALPMIAFAVAADEVDGIVASRVP